MEKLIEILTELDDSYDYHKETGLFSDKKLDSFSLVGLVSEIREVFDVKIPAYLITPENFDSAEKLYHLIESLKAKE